VPRLEIIEKRAGYRQIYSEHQSQEQPPKFFGVATQVRPNYGAGLYSRFGDFGLSWSGIIKLKQQLSVCGNVRAAHFAGCLQRREKIACRSVANKGPGFIDELVNMMST